MLDQARATQVADQIPVQSVTLMSLPFTSVRDLDCQCQLRHDQTVVKRQPSPLEVERHKRAKTPPQLDPQGASDRGRAQEMTRESRDHGRSRIRGEERQKELDKARARSKSRKRSKSRRWRSNSRRRSQSCGREEEEESPGWYQMKRPGVWSSRPNRHESSQPPRESTSPNKRDTEQLAPRKDPSNFLKLRDKVVKHPQNYIRRRIPAIYCTLSPDHEAVKCLSAFRDQARKFAAEMLATIEWGTQHWSLQESFLVPIVPKWLHMIKYIQMTTPVCREMQLAPASTHYEDIQIRCPVVWSWMAVLLQFWQDHTTTHLFGGHFRQMSDLACTIIRDINVWMPHCTRFGWSYITRHAVLWLDIRDQFSEEHLEEWEAQKYHTMGLNDLEHETEVVYRDRIISRQDAKERADSKEAAAQELPLDRRAAQAERQACMTPTKVDADVSSTNAGVPLYPNWVVRSTTKPTSQDVPTHYRAPREDVTRTLTLSKELDEASVLDPLQLEFQSSQPDTADSSGAEGPRTPPHYSDVSSTVPPFDLAQLGILPKMSPVTEQENDLLNMAPRIPHQACCPTRTEPEP